MMALDPVAIWNRIPDPKLKDYEYLYREQVPAGCLVTPDLIKVGPVVFVGTRFEFAAPEDRPVKAYLFLARDMFGEPVDIVAWRGDFIGTFLGSASMLGQENTFAPRLPPDTGLPVFRTPIKWLRNRNTGVLVLNLPMASYTLHHEELIGAEDESHRRELEKATWKGPRITVSERPRGGG